jgi:hypothetical protein
MGKKVRNTEYRRQNKEEEAFWLMTKDHTQRGLAPSTLLW